MKNKYEQLKKKISDIAEEFNIKNETTLTTSLQAIYLSKRETLRSLSKRSNHKIGYDTLIFNMGSAYKCPSDELGLCKLSKKCYAKKAEDQYWFTVSNYRNQQAEYWKNVTAEQFVAEFIDIYKAADIEIKYIRFNESGDFYTQKCVDKLLKIAQLLKKNKLKTKIYTYTARTDLDFSNCLKQSNLIINGSGFMLDNNFDVYYKDSDLRQGDLICKGDCSICNYCKLKKEKTIRVKIH